MIFLKSRETGLLHTLEDDTPFDKARFEQISGETFAKLKLVEDYKKDLISVMGSHRVIYTVLRKTNLQGTNSRHFTVLLSSNYSSVIRDVTYQVAALTGATLRDGLLVVRGTGFSASQSIASDLGQVLYNDMAAVKHVAL